MYMYISPKTDLTQDFWLNLNCQILRYQRCDKHAQIITVTHQELNCIADMATFSCLNQTGYRLSNYPGSFSDSYRERQCCRPVLIIIAYRHTGFYDSMVLPTCDTGLAYNVTGLDPLNVNSTYIPCSNRKEMKERNNV